MIEIPTIYDANELAYVSDWITLEKDIYLLISLKERGKVVIRQDGGDGHTPRTPVKMHQDTKDFELRLRLAHPGIKIRIYTSTEPKSIRYANV